MEAPTLHQGAANTGEQGSVGGLPAHEAGPDCRHYWEIEIAVSQLSTGVCRLCRSHREFSNYFADCLAGTGKREGYYDWLCRDECQQVLTPYHSPASPMASGGYAWGPGLPEVRR